MWYPILITVLAGYLLGNLNGAFSVSALSHDDVRSHGSGNAGLTNFIRSFGGAKALLVVVIDMSKTALSCLMGGLLLKPYGLYQEGMMLGAVAVSLGHDFPAVLGFKGGKGILCGLTIALIIDWRVAVILAVVFFGVYFTTHYVSLASVLGSVGFGVCFVLLYLGNLPMMLGGAFLAAMAVLMHRENIQRLLTRTERKSYLFHSKKNK